MGIPFSACPPNRRIDEARVVKRLKRSSTVITQKTNRRELQICGGVVTGCSTGVKYLMLSRMVAHIRMRTF
jgi:hypothetical protein